MVCICLYFTYLGWRVIYFCSKASQMTQPKKYMRRIIDGSFLIYCIKKPHREFYAKEAVEFEGGGTLTILNLTESKGRSPRCDVVLYDEEAEVEADAYMAAESILDGSDIGLTIHASTPVKGSKFEENRDILKLREATTGHELIFSREYDEISFLVDTPAKRAKYEEKKRLWPPWYFRQELQCSFELPSGAVFQNVIYDPYPDWLLEEIEQERLLSGMDWNPVAGHWLSGGKWRPNLKGIVVLHSLPIAVGYTHQLKEDAYLAIKEYCTYGKKLCAESGGINEEYHSWLKGMLAKDRNKRDVNIKWEEWDPQGINKINIVLYLLSRTIYVDEILFPILAKQIKDCHWKKGAKKIEIEKDNADSPHAFDAFLHFASKKLIEEPKYRRFEWHA